MELLKIVLNYHFFANIIGSDLRPHFKSFTRAQKLRGLKSGLKPDHFQQSKLSNNHLNTRIVNNKSHFQQCTIIPSIRPDRWVGSNSTVGSFTSATARPYSDKRDDLQAFPYPTGQVVRRRLPRPKIDLSKSFPFSRRDVAPNVGIGRLAEKDLSSTTQRAATRNNILSYLGISPIPSPG